MRKSLAMQDRREEQVRLLRTFDSLYDYLAYEGELSLRLKEPVECMSFLQLHQDYIEDFGSTGELLEHFFGVSDEYLEYLFDTYVRDWSSVTPSISWETFEKDYDKAIKELARTYGDFSDFEVRPSPARLRFVQEKNGYERIALPEDFLISEEISLPLASRCDGNHKRAIRRKESFRAKTRRMSLGISDSVLTEDTTFKSAGQLERKGSYIWLKYTVAKEKLVAETLSVLEMKECIATVQKYKKLVQFAEHYDSYSSCEENSSAAESSEVNTATAEEDTTSEDKSSSNASLTVNVHPKTVKKPMSHNVGFSACHSEMKSETTGAPSLILHSYFNPMAPFVRNCLNTYIHYHFR